VRGGRASGNSDWTCYFVDPISGIPNVIADADAGYTIARRYDYGLDYYNAWEKLDHNLG